MFQLERTKSLNYRILLIISVVVGMFIFFFTRPVMVQPLEYHNFVDRRTFFGVPNAQDVLSNVFFLFVGVLGIKEISGRKVLLTRRSWLWFFISVLLVAPGSAYYHWAPDNMTLVWDRLPMSMGFMALYIVLFAEHVSLALEKFLYFALLTGLLSVMVWVITTDLRFYFWIQFSSFVTIPLILGLFPSRYSMKPWYMVALLFYGLAKWAEVKDGEVFEMTNFLISGHSLKHILAAVGLASLWWMVKTRKELSVTAASGSVADSSRRL